MAKLVVSHVPDVEVIGLTGGEYVLDPSRHVTIGVDPSVDIVVRGAHIGGRRNSRIEWRDGSWVLVHLGHACAIYVNGDPWRARSCSRTATSSSPSPKVG